MGNNQSLRILQEELDDKFEGLVESKPMPEIKENEWLKHIKERGETLEDFIKMNNYDDRRIHKQREKQATKLYILDLDSDLTKSEKEFLVDAIQKYFQLDVVFLKNELFVDTSDASKFRYHLSRLKPDDCFSLIGITSKDITSQGLRFVFGETEICGERIGIFSTCRLRNAFYSDLINGFDTFDASLEEKSIALKKYNLDLLKDDSNEIKRIFKLLVHEFLHAFGLEHCIYHNCIARGHLSVFELDSLPFTMCSICIKKLYFIHPFDIDKMIKNQSMLDNSSKKII